MDKDKRPQLTTSSGSPVENNQNSQTVGPDGPTLLQDFHLIDKISHFDRERIPERVVHAKGAGAHGFFEVTDDITRFCKAKLFDTIGKESADLKIKISSNEQCISTNCRISAWWILRSKCILPALLRRKVKHQQRKLTIKCLLLQRLQS